MSRKLVAEVKYGVEISFCAHAGEWDRHVSSIVPTSRFVFFKIIGELCLIPGSELTLA